MPDRTALRWKGCCDWVGVGGTAGGHSLALKKAAGQKTRDAVPGWCNACHLLPLLLQGGLCVLA